MQELIWSTQPDLIVETGIAHGGSLIFSASMLELNAPAAATELASSASTSTSAPTTAPRSRRTRCSSASR